MDKKITSSLVTAVLLTLQLIKPVYAGPYDEQQKKVYAVTDTLKKIIEIDYENTISNIKEEIRDKGYDYELSMETVEYSGNPYNSINYVDILSLYMAAKKNAKSLNKEIPLLSDIKFVDYQFEEIDITTNKVTEYDNYVSVIIGDEVKDKFDKDTEYFMLDGKAYTRDEITIDDYIQYKNTGLYIKSGTKTIIPDKETLKYVNVTFSNVDNDLFLKKIGFTFDQIKDDYEKGKALLEKYISNKEIKESVNLNTPDINLSSVKDFSYIENTRRRLLVETASSLIGKVPYQWGGKPLKEGYDTLWWTFNEDSEQIGLDCSGFVEWAFLTAGYPEEVYKRLHSTSAILKAGFKEIPKSDLQPGDIGLLNSGESTNHTGIYLGNGKWIHCSSSAGTVTISDFKFRRYYSVFDSVFSKLKDEDSIEYSESIGDEIYIKDKDIYAFNYIEEPVKKDTEEKTEIEENSSIKEKTTIEDIPIAEDIIKQNENDIVTIQNIFNNSLYSENDIYLAAQLIYHEANSEGLNGWIAVGEVVKNRVESNLFPNTIPEVVYQKGQFTNSKALKNITPSQELIDVTRQVLSGNMKILNNNEVYFFRNPMITSNIPASTPQNWGKHPYYCGIGHHAFYLR